MSISINIGDQVTIVHKDFVAICEVVQTRAPSNLFEHACCQAQGHDPDQAQGQCTQDACNGYSALDPAPPGKVITAIQVVRSSPRGD